MAYQANTAGSSALPSVEPVLAQTRLQKAGGSSVEITGLAPSAPGDAGEPTSQPHTRTASKG